MQQYVWSFDDEYHSEMYPSRETALADAREEARVHNAYDKKHLQGQNQIEKIYIGEATPAGPVSSHFYLSDVDDRIKDGDVLCEEEADDFEGFGGAPEKERGELEDKIRALMDEFCEKHNIRISSYEVENVKEYPVEEPEAEGLKS